MATGVGTAGTHGTTSLPYAFQFYCLNDTSGVNPGANQFTADVGSINNRMRDDKAYIFPEYSGQANSNVIVPAIPVAQGGTAGAVAAGLLSGGFTTSGLLQIPNRGNLRVLPGDVVMIGITGWPILLSRAEAVYGQANSIWSSSVAWT